MSYCGANQETADPKWLTAPDLFFSPQGCEAPRKVDSQGPEG